MDRYRIATASLLLCMPLAALAVEAGRPVPKVAAARLDAPATKVDLAGFKGKVAYVDFWASWCAPCRVSMPVLDGLGKRYGAEGFVVVGVNKDTGEAEAKRFLERVPVSFTLVRDADDAVAKAFDVKAMPSGYLVDRKGVVRYVHRGYSGGETAAAIERQVQELLKESP